MRTMDLENEYADDLKLFENLKIVLALQEKQENSFQKQFVHILQFAKDIHEKKDKFRREYGLFNGKVFNIFSLFSDKYYREGFHDEVLIAILNPQTPTIGNKIFLETFLNAIGVSSDEFGSRENIKVDAQNGRIDILIYNEKNAIIIENKLYNAPDMPNQLARYYKRVTEELKLNVSKIVYLPLEPTKKPNFENYDKEYHSLVPEIEKCLKILPAVKENKDDIVRGWFDKIDFDKAGYKNDDAKNLAKVFVGQYKNLLLSLGETELMKEAEKKIFEEIYSDKEKLKAVIDFVDTWNNDKVKNEFLYEAIKEKIQESDAAYIEIKLHDFNILAKKINDDMSVYFFGNNQVGYVSNNDNPLPKSLEKVFEEAVNINPVNTDDVWIWSCLSLDEKWNLQERSDKIISMLKKLEEKAFSNK